MRDLGLPARIRAKGVDVVLVPGWETRGGSDYAPRGSVNHHTAGASRGAVPSLGICTYGRSDLPGPLCQVLQSREPVGWDKAYVIAAERANHAGQGGWQGLSGNARVSGLEIEHVGTASVAYQRLEVAARIQAALLEAPGSTRSAKYLCQHFEWTTRKIDFHNLAPHFNVHTFRGRVAYWIGRTVDGVQEDDDMTPAESRLLTEIAAAVVPHRQVDDTRFRVQTLVGPLVEPGAEKAIKDVAPAVVHKALADVLKFEAGVGEGPIHEILKQVLRELAEEAAKADPADPDTTHLS